MKGESGVDSDLDRNLGFRGSLAPLAYVSSTIGYDINDLVAKESGRSGLFQ